MIQIRPDQMDAFRRARPDLLRAEFRRRLPLEYPDTAGRLSREEVARAVDDGYADATALEIFEPDDVYRLIALPYLPGFDLRHPYHQSAVLRILNNTAASGTERLDFIYTNVVPRPAPPDNRPGLTPNPPA